MLWKPVCRLCPLSLSLQNTLLLLGVRCPNAMPIELFSSPSGSTNILMSFPVLFIFISISILQAQIALPIQNPTIKSHLVNYSRFFFQICSFPSCSVNKTSNTTNIMSCNIQTHTHSYLLFIFLLLGPGLALVTVPYRTDSLSTWKKISLKWQSSIFLLPNFKSRSISYGPSMY